MDTYVIPLLRSHKYHGNTAFYMTWCVFVSISVD